MREYTTSEMVAELEEDSTKRFISMKSSYFRTAQVENGYLIFKDHREDYVNMVQLNRKWVEVE